MAQLQQPEFVYTQGKLQPWKDAKLHVGCEAITRGLNVYEGLKGYWQTDGRFGIVTIRRHYDRLRRSARLSCHLGVEARQPERGGGRGVNECREPPQFARYLAIQNVEVAYMLAVKRSSLLVGILYGAWIFKEQRVMQHLVAGALMVAGVILVAM